MATARLNTRKTTATTYIRAVAIAKDGIIVGHLPRELVRTVFFFLSVEVLEDVK